MRLSGMIAATVAGVGSFLAMSGNQPTIEVPELQPPPVSQCCDDCGDVCTCEVPCECGDEEDLTSHIGKLVTRSTRPGVWRVVDAWRNDDGVLMYLYRLEQTTAGSNCPGGVCPSPSDQIQTGYYDGTSGWTYPGDIASHLRSSQHMIPAEQMIGKSKDELEALHDALHDSRTTQTTSSCPGGVCPSPTTTRRTWRWRR